MRTTRLIAAAATAAQKVADVAVQDTDARVVQELKGMAPTTDSNSGRATWMGPLCLGEIGGLGRAMPGVQCMNRASPRKPTP
jgi:hypothetical protein